MGRGKAAIIRKTRRAAQLNKGLTKLYKERLEEWDEDSSKEGTPTPVIRLRPGWSFTPFASIKTKAFTTTAEAMRGIHKTYPYPGYFKSDEERKIALDNWPKR